MKPRIMTPDDKPQIRFGRLNAVDPETIADHMNDPTVATHMPLLKGVWDRQTACDFIAMKEGYWTRDGLGHWAIFHDENYVGWGGFQKEGAEWDFGLVLKPSRFGLGWAILRKALEFAETDPRIPHVTFLLPPSRKRLGGLARLGSRHVGEVAVDGARFSKFRLSTR